MKETNEVMNSNQYIQGSVHSKIIKIGKLLFISHELPLDPVTGELITDDFTKAIKTCMENLRTDVESQGIKPDNIISTTVYMKNQEHLKAFEEFFSAFFGNRPPARKIIEGGLHDNIPIKIDAVAILR